MAPLIMLAERGLLSDGVIRIGIRRNCDLRAREVQGLARSGNALESFLAQHGDAPIAVQTEAANSQHYEVPPAFFEMTIGPYLKYSSGLWENGAKTLEEAEREMLDLSIDRAGVVDGMRVLDLGCGWGSMSMRLAERFPGADITAVSNSHSQRRFIEQRSAARGLANIRVITCDINELEFDQPFDRVLSVEMFEHMRNHRALLERVQGWMKADGKLFVHVFCHHAVPYLYEVRDNSDWMAQHFFSGGMMPSRDYLPACSDRLQLESQWDINGLNYARTCRAWLDQADHNAGQLAEVLDAACPHSSGRVALQRWRMFFMACEELFRFRNGREWFVAHYLFTS